MYLTPPFIIFVPVSQPREDTLWVLLHFTGLTTTSSTLHPVILSLLLPLPPLPTDTHTLVHTLISRGGGAQPWERGPLCPVIRLIKAWLGQVAMVESLTERMLIIVCFLSNIDLRKSSGKYVGDKSPPRYIYILDHRVM